MSLIYQDNHSTFGSKSDIYYNHQSQSDCYYPIGTKEVIRTEQISISPEDKPTCEILSYYCHISKNVYNEANYEAIQEYSKYDHYMGYVDLEQITKKKSKNYKLLPASSSQQTIRILDKSGWIRYFKSVKDYYIHPEKYLCKPRLPGYLRKDGEFILVFTGSDIYDKKKKNRQVKIKDGYLTFPKKIYKKPSKLGDLKIKTRLDEETNISEVRIIPKSKGNSKKIGYTIEIVYKIEEHQLDLNKDRIIGIDFGLRNIVAIANNIGEIPIIIKGGVERSINQYYNKIRAKIQSIYDRQSVMCLSKNRKIVYRKTGPAIQILTVKRNNKIKDAMHKISRWIINYCIQHNIGTIVIGYNPEWKQEINLGKKTNQNFVQIPFVKLLEMIKYKADEIGIKVIEQEESHTSKCSFLDNEPVGHSGKYLGKRISRGLFKSSIGKIINADVQGCYNIIKKAIPKAFDKLVVIRADGIEGVGLHPIRVDPLNVNRNVQVNNL